MFLQNMAATSRSIFCPGCGNSYNTTDYRPKHLPCAHTVCKDCIQQALAEPSEALTCPECHSTTSKQNTMAITTDFAALELCTKEALVLDEVDNDPVGTDVAASFSTLDQSTAAETLRETLDVKFDEALAEAEKVVVAAL